MQRVLKDRIRLYKLLPLQNNKLHTLLGPHNTIHISVIYWFGWIFNPTNKWHLKITRSNPRANSSPQCHLNSSPRHSPMVWKMLRFLVVYCLVLVRDFSKFLPLYRLSLFLWHITAIRSTLPPSNRVYFSGGFGHQFGAFRPSLS